MTEYKNIISGLNEGDIALLESDLPEINDINIKSIKKKFKKKTHKPKWGIRTLLAVAATVIIFIGTVNINPVFAAYLLDVPVVGKIAEWITFDKVELHDAYREIYIVVPSVNGLEDDTLQTEINELLRSRSIAVFDKTMAEAERLERKDSLGFVTSLPERVMQTFKMIKHDDTMLSFKVITTSVKASAAESVYIYNVDLMDNKLLVLSDLFQNDYDYRTNLNDVIKSFMIDANENNDASYFLDNFVTVDDETQFYFNDEGNLVIVFNEYEVAAGYMGMPEITIERDYFGEDLKK